jgi:hypothetical protein
MYCTLYSIYSTFHAVLNLPVILYSELLYISSSLLSGRSRSHEGSRVLLCKCKTCSGFVRLQYNEHTANEGPVRIQYKCLVPIDMFPKVKLLFPKQNYNVLFPSSYTHISVRNFQDFQDRSAYSAAGKYVDRAWEYINR